MLMRDGPNPALSEQTFRTGFLTLAACGNQPCVSVEKLAVPRASQHQMFPIGCAGDHRISS